MVVFLFSAMVMADSAAISNGRADPLTRGGAAHATRIMTTAQSPWEFLLLKAG